MAPCCRRKIVTPWLSLGCSFAACVSKLVSRKRKYKPNQKPTRKWIEQRTRSGFSEKLIPELRKEDDEGHKIMFRISSEVFDMLLEKIEPLIKKEDTNMKLAIPCRTALAITLKYLADGTSYNSLSYEFRVSKSYICVTIPEVCSALTTVLSCTTEVPKTKLEWLRIAYDFEKKWNFPHCLGAVDGKHIAIVKPSNSGSEYYNYKGFSSLVLLASVDAHGKVIAYDVGRPGSCGDAGIFADSKLGRLLHRSIAPGPSQICDYPPVGYFNIGDDAFALSSRMLKPYCKRSAELDERIFNYRLSRARRISENCFGIMASRFKILRRPAHNNPENMVKIVKAIIPLHNYLITERLRFYSPLGYQDFTNEDGTMIEGSWRQNNINLTSLRQTHGNSFTDGSRNRNILRKYFMNEGQVDFQWKNA